MKEQEAIEEINGLLDFHLGSRFRKAGIPVIKFNIFKMSEDNTFDVTPLFIQNNENSFVRLKVNSKEEVTPVLKSGTIEIDYSGSNADFFAAFAIEIFKKIALEASILKMRKTGVSRYDRHLKRADSDDFINIDNITYIDFPELDLSDINFSEIYCTY